MKKHQLIIPNLTVTTYLKLLYKDAVLKLIQNSGDVRKVLPSPCAALS